MDGIRPLVIDGRFGVRMASDRIDHDAAGTLAVLVRKDAGARLRMGLGDAVCAGGPDNVGTAGQGW